MANRYPFVSLKVLLGLSLIFFAFARTAPAQDATSAASAARTRYLSDAGLFPASREVAVEEFVNYRRHEIGRPRAGEAVALDLRWGNDYAPGLGREAILQVGFSTALAGDRQHLRPLNLALVIDKSGSMADADKMSRVKEALLALVSRLRDEDILSIVVFDEGAQVWLPACSLTNRNTIKQAIRGIEPGGSTNIHAGLMLGYREAHKNLRRDATNRVILLTDGIANRGETVPERIARDSLRFNDDGIDLSTIGVGMDLNMDLLRQLARSGRGLFHFVSDPREIEKVFINELQSLISPVAMEPCVEIDYDSDLELQQLYGYEPQLRRNGVTIRLDNMNRGMTQVILMRFRLPERRPAAARLPVRVRFTYYDLERKRQIAKTEEAFLAVKDGLPGDPLKDPEVGKNYSIALLAQAIRDMAVACEARRFREAEYLLTDAINRTCQRYPNLEEPDIRRVLSIAQKYQSDLRRYNQSWGAGSDR